MKASNGCLRTRLSNHSKPVLCIAVSTEYMAVGSEDFTCTVYPIPTEKELAKK